MKRVKIIQQGNWYSLYYDGELYTRQFPVSASRTAIIACLASLMPDYIAEFVA